MVWEQDARYFADVDGLEFIDQNLTPIPTAWGLVGTDTVRFAGGYTGSGLNRDAEISPSVLDAKPGYPVTEYRRDCGDGRFAQIFHFVHVDSPRLWSVGADFMQFNAYPQQIEGDLWEYLDEDEQYGFRGIERPLRDVGPDNDNLLSREYVRQLASYATPDDGIQYGGFVYTSFNDSAGEIVEVLIAAASHMEVNKQPDNGIVSEPLNEDEPIKLDGLIDHPIVEERITCAGETWQLLSPVIDQFQDS